ncbi:PRC-barrel domain-containing protein [Streptomyces sp. NPDC007172]|uniref:PRC-barrel domain-containing protein n=1 Tax=Streptomyces sp. NPDC007172 TaxID=3364776 RepID=UPI0036C8F1CD
MNVLMLAGELAKRPVVTLGGEAVGQVKDTVFDAAGARITGFTLAGRGLLAGPLKQSLPWSGVHFLGPDAVMIPSTDVLEDRAAVVARSEAGHGQVRGARVLTDGGLEVGTVLDVVIEGGADGRVVGVHLTTTDALGKKGRKVFMPAQGRLSMTGDTLVVPGHTAGRVSEDLGALAEELLRGPTASPAPGEGKTL